jgi:hypothetical protein
MKGLLLLLLRLLGLQLLAEGGVVCADGCHIFLRTTKNECLEYRRLLVYVFLFERNE